MLSPDDRALLVDLLAPPPGGFKLVRAVATTFTLDLTALLPIPLCLAGTDLSSSTDQLSILQAVRNYSDRIDVFFQAGNVSIPSKHNALLTFLEQMVHAVKAPAPGRLFHPKLWVLRYVTDDGEERFRLVCGSRNLTGDRAWDAVVSLEGRRTRQRRALNRPISEFLASLSDRVPAGVPPERRAGISELADALRYVEWDPPADVLGDDWLTFHVFGPGRRTRPDMKGYRRLVVSPFLDDAGLDEAWPDGTGECVVVSRDKELDAAGQEWRDRFEGRDMLYVLDRDAAIPEPESDEAGLRWTLSGLHAKLYVLERMNRAHVFVGSANMTDAAWGGNDELLVEIVGRVRTYGVDATLGSPGGATGPAGFGRILLPYTLREPVAESADEELFRKLENALRTLASLTFTAIVEGEQEHPLLWVRSDEPLRAAASLPADIELTVEPLTLANQHHRPSFGNRLDHRWQLSQVEEITPFLAMRLSSGAVTANSVVLARLIGDPPDRLDRVLAMRIGTEEAFLRFLLLLLQLAGREDWFPESEGEGGGPFGAFGTGEGGAGLLESILAALASTPGAIDDIDRIVKQLSATERGRQVLPPRWGEFWPSVIEARSRLGAKR